MSKFIFFLLGVFAGIACIKFMSKQNEIKPQYIYETKTDTVTEYKIIRDTTFVEIPKLCKEIIRDTVWIDSLIYNDYNHLIVSQKEYRDSNYVAWVSGVEPQLDSIMVFNNIEHVFKTSTIETVKTPTIETVKTIEDNTGKLFAGAGLYSLDNTLVPKLNVVYQKKRIMVGASVGLYNNQPIYGVDFNLKFK